jgi:hypothetical protein
MFPPSQYFGVELEINQRHPLRGGPAWRAMQATIAAALAEALAALNEPARATPRERGRADAAPTNVRTSHSAPSAH